MKELEYKISKLLQEQQPITESEAQDLAHFICELPELKAIQAQAKVKVQIAKPTYKEIETYVDKYINMGGFTKPEEAKPYLMDGFEKGYNYLKNKLSNLSA